MRTQRPFGHYKYWPVLEAAAERGLPIAFHPGGTGMNQITGSGWPSFYFEHHAGYPQSMVSQVSSLITHGVLERWPDLKVVVVEGGWSWAAPFAWRMDASWRVLRSEVPHLTRKPSEYLAEHFWFTTQPAEEPENRDWTVEVIEQFESLGLAEHLMYSSDYPHWDFDAPDQALPRAFGEERTRRIMSENAAALYGFTAENVRAGGRA
jgi:predicted TIM-barrel fold metal-dependent hydrolase